VGVTWTMEHLSMMKKMFCAICQEQTCDSCFVPEYTRFLMKMGEQESCVLCQRKTRYRIGEQIAQRQYYVEGSGQLCEDCYHQLTE